MAEPLAEEAGRRSATRSPSYPYIDLKAALEKAEVFRAKEGRNSASFEVAVANWRYSPKSSGAKQTVAALRAFGLLEPEGAIKLTDIAHRILLDKRDPSPEREALIRRLALNPPMHKRLWDRYGHGLPSDPNLKHTLIFEYGFNENSVEDFIQEYKATVAFAKLQESGSMPSEGEDREENPPPGGAMHEQPNNPPPKPPSPPPSIIGAGSLPPVTFPLSGDNALEIRLRSKISKAEFDRLKPVLMSLLELSVVEAD